MGFRKFLLFTSLSIILLTESIWAMDAVSFPQKVQQGAIFLMQPAVTSPKVGEIFTVDVTLNTNQGETVGADAKIFFDPKILKALAPKKGQIFEKYPLIQIDNRKGEVRVSGISRKKFSGEGRFAQLTFQALKAGKTALGFLFQPGSTVDSNVAIAGNDILQAVKNAIIRVKK